MSNQPNILFITTDQQRYDASGGAGPSFLRTPHFDVLRRQGVRFTGARADCPICVPSRVSWMTGKTVLNHGMDTNGPTTDVMGRENTLPALLRECGYQTAAVGKMHFGPMRSRHGFDEMILPDDYYREMRRRGSTIQPMRHGLGQNELYPSMATVPESETLTSWIAEQCVSYIRDRRDPNHPFFLWCSFGKPHPPLDPPEPYYSMYRDCPIPEPVFGDWSEDARCPIPFARHRENWSCDLVPPEILREARAAYYGLITQIDYNIGRVLAALQDAGLYNETFIVYTSDHGEFLGDHHSGGKFTFHEASARVPLAVRPPMNWDLPHRGSECGALATTADVLPTLVQAAGGRVPDDADGRDLMAMWRGEDGGRDYLLASAMDGLYYAITDGRRKYMYYPEGAGEQYFDLTGDPLELHDLAGDAESREDMEALRRELVARLTAMGSEAVREGELVAKEPRGDSAAERRARPWPGFHTDHAGIDVCH